MKLTRLFTQCSIAIVALVTFTLGLAGCGGGLDDAYKGPTGTVKGTVKLDGNPVSVTCNISFINLEAGYTGSATTESGGTYSLSFKDGSSNMPVGKYSVSVTAAADPNAKEPTPEEAMEKAMAQQEKGGTATATPPATAIPAKYTAPATSGLSFEVKEGENTIDLELSSK